MEGFEHFWESLVALLTALFGGREYMHSRARRQRQVDVATDTDIVRAIREEGKAGREQMTQEISAVSTAIDGLSGEIHSMSGGVQRLLGRGEGGGP